MKHLIYFLPLCFLLTACPYDASVELNPYTEAMKVEKAYFGDWQAFDVSGEATREELHISKGDKGVYHIQHDPYDEDNKKVEGYYYRGYATDIAGTAILNVEKKDGTWNYYKYKMAGDDEFVLNWVESEFMKKNPPSAPITTEGMRKFIEENMKKEGFFGPDVHFYREGSAAFKKAKG